MGKSVSVGEASAHLQTGVKSISLGVLYGCMFLFLVETTKTESTRTGEK